jgi:hypothetical protein
MKPEKIKPYSEVKAKLGQANTAWKKLTGYIRFYYEMDECWEEGNPTHKHHSNLRFRRGGKTLITLAIREGYFIAAIVLGKEERERFEEQREKFGKAICNEYDNTEIFHDGKWMGFDVRDESLIDDIINLLPIKRKPNRKVLPKSLESCGRLDIGLSHQEITSILFLQ